MSESDAFWHVRSRLWTRPKYRGIPATSQPEQGQGPAEDSIYDVIQVRWTVVYPGRATDADGGNLQVCGVWSWMSRLLAFERSTRVWERDVGLPFPAHDTTGWRCGSGSLWGTCLSLALHCIPLLGPDRCVVDG